jgi:hypothetical protein
MRPVHKIYVEISFEIFASICRVARPHKTEDHNQKQVEYCVPVLRNDSQSVAHYDDVALSDDYLAVIEGCMPCVENSTVARDPEEHNR